MDTPTAAFRRSEPQLKCRPRIVCQVPGICRVNPCIQRFVTCTGVETGRRVRGFFISLEHRAPEPRTDRRDARFERPARSHCRIARTNAVFYRVRIRTTPRAREAML